MTDYEIFIYWEFSLFYRRWQGWKSILWYIWPIRWCFHRNYNGMTVTDYYLSANDAAIAMSKFVIDHNCERTNHD